MKHTSSGAVRITTCLKPIGGNADFVPFISVFFLSLLFFMLCSQFAQVSGIKVELPETAASNYAARKYVVTIAPGGRIYFNDEVITMDSLRTHLAGLDTRERPTIILRADGSVPYVMVAKVMGMAEENGSNVILLTSVPPVTSPVTSPVRME